MTHSDTSRRWFTADGNQIRHHCLLESTRRCESAPVVSSRSTLGRRLFTEVLAQDGLASGLAQVGLFMGDKNAPDEFGAVCSVR